MKTALLSLLLSTAALAQTCDYYPLNTCNQQILGRKIFLDGIEGNIYTDGGTSTGDLTVNGDAGVSDNATIANTLTATEGVFDGGLVATQTNGRAGGNACMYLPVRNAGSYGEAILVEHPLISGSAASLFWAQYTSNGDGGSIIFTIKNSSTNKFLFSIDAGCANGAASTGAVGVLDGGVAAGQILGIFADTSGCSGERPEGNICAGW